ncbi:MAG: dihydroorotate dehydrogenase-like protein [Verrucomicrobia bacterium]|nr:dihydroorotate dehydrogenase-like protein [Verrucomicrobiota bacterium]
MNLTSQYLGMKLRTPLVPSASPLSDNLDNVKRMEDAGAAAVVFHSLFEEHIQTESRQLHHHLTHGTESYAEALTYFPELDELTIGPEIYLNEIAAAKAAVAIPIIASLNGSTLGGWTEYAKQIEQAGADALELNIYWIPTDPEMQANEVESRYLEITKHVKAVVSIPVAVKLSPFFSSFAHMAKELVSAGADALVLFNRFYQPDIDVEGLEVSPNILLSTPMAMRLPLRWIAILRGRVHADLAATSGIHRATDVIKMVMAGADVTMLCSVLLRRGIGHIRVIEHEIEQWLQEHEYDSLDQLRGSMCQRSCPDPEAFERAQYIRGISTSWRTISNL